jgi:hypothetical protein
MKKEKIFFALGIITGIFISSMFFQFFAPRYLTLKEGESFIKLDKWSGRSWRYVTGKWEEIPVAEKKYEEIDSEIRKALKVIIDQTNFNDVLSSFKRAFPALKDISDEELFTRISNLYSKQLLTATFLHNYYLMLKEREKKINQRATD